MLYLRSIFQLNTTFHTPHTVVQTVTYLTVARTYSNNFIGLGMYVVQGVSLGRFGRM